MRRTKASRMLLEPVGSPVITDIYQRRSGRSGDDRSYSRVFSMIEELLPNLYRIKVPLPASPLKFLNSYAIHGGERWLIIDTGMNREECLTVMNNSLAELDVDLKKTDFFITHIHADHAGLVGTLATENATVFFNQKESQMMYQMNRWQELYFDFYHAVGFPEDELKEAIEGHPGRRFGLRKRFDFNILKEGDILPCGDFQFRVIETPGHSPGHLCLYEGEKQVLVCGDHILFDITPNISYWHELDNSLKDYLDNLQKVYPLEVKLLLPGHRSLIHDHRKRINELREHHRNRLNEVIAALADGEKDAYHIAPCITWDIAIDSWAEFPPPQKWFAFGETLAHVIYLEREGRVRRISRDGRITFALN
ncbi:MBL fold metallo-hydrolase [Chloroflexota bacterium]